MYSTMRAATLLSRLHCVLPVEPLTHIHTHTLNIKFLLRTQSLFTCVFLSLLQLLLLCAWLKLCSRSSLLVHTDVHTVMLIYILASFKQTLLLNKQQSTLQLQLEIKC
jgi:hypothetical protein